jgi:hypothetical protein
VDLRHYYAKLRQIETGLEGDYVVVVSQETPDGGRAGVLNEAPRALAAKLIAEGQARLANEEERRAFHEKHATARKIAEQAAAVRRVQVAVVPEADLRASRRKE